MFAGIFNEDVRIFLMKQSISVKNILDLVGIKFTRRKYDEMEIIFNIGTDFHLDGPESGSIIPLFWRSNPQQSTSID